MDIATGSWSLMANKWLTPLLPPRPRTRRPRRTGTRRRGGTPRCRTQPQALARQEGLTGRWRTSSSQKLLLALNELCLFLRLVGRRLRLTVAPPLVVKVAVVVAALAHVAPDAVHV